MKIPTSEIWNFIEQIEEKESGWSCEFHIGKVTMKDLTISDLLEIKNDDSFDTELLPELFTFREILWQPDVFTSAAQAITPIRILSSFCDEQIEYFKQSKKISDQLTLKLLKGIRATSNSAIKSLNNGNSFHKILRKYRQALFPMVKFLVYHPCNRRDYQKDAINRLNFAVKIMLTDYNSRYTELEDAYCQITFNKQQKVAAKA